VAALDDHGEPRLVPEQDELLLVLSVFDVVREREALLREQTTHLVLCELETGD
jgi:hypothetical protein